MSAQCPYCGGTTGYYQVQQVRRHCEFNWDACHTIYSNDSIFYKGKAQRCIDCDEKITSYVRGVEMALDNDDPVPTPVDPNPAELGLDFNEVQVQVDSNQKGVKLTHQPTGCTVVCDKHDTQFENQAAALKELAGEVNKHLAWGPQDDHLVIPSFLRRGGDND